MPLCYCWSILEVHASEKFLSLSKRLSFVCNHSGCLSFWCLLWYSNVLSEFMAVNCYNVPFVIEPHKPQNLGEYPWEELDICIVIGWFFNYFLTNSINNSAQKNNCARSVCSLYLEQPTTYHVNINLCFICRIISKNVFPPILFHDVSYLVIYIYTCIKCV